MKAYMVHAGDAHECAVLVFANTAKQAKQIGRADIVNFTDCQYIDIRVERIKNDAVVRGYALSDQPHVVDSPPSCNACCQWGREIIDGRCDSCREFDAEEAQ